MITKRKQFHFKTTILGIPKEWFVEVPINNTYVVTSAYRPKELLGDKTTQEPSFLNVLAGIQGEGIQEFKTDCAFLVEAMKTSKATSLLEVHLDALQRIVELHVRCYNRLIYTDLLLYIDCFSLLLKADGYAEKMIKETYWVVMCNLVEQYKPFVKDPNTLQPLANSELYKKLLASNKISFN